jgi:hypothetical protein
LLFDFILPVICYRLCVNVRPWFNILRQREMTLVFTTLCMMKL